MPTSSSIARVQATLAASYWVTVLGGRSPAAVVREFGPSTGRALDEWLGTCEVEAVSAGSDLTIEEVRAGRTKAIEAIEAAVDEARADALAVWLDASPESPEEGEAALELDRLGVTREERQQAADDHGIANMVATSPAVAYGLHEVARCEIDGTSYVVYDEPGTGRFALSAADWDRETTETDYSVWCSATNGVGEATLLARILAATDVEHARTCGGFQLVDQITEANRHALVDFGAEVGAEADDHYYTSTDRTLT